MPRITKLLQSIEFYDSIVVIRKADGERDVPASVFTADPAAPRSTDAHRRGESHATDANAAWNVNRGSSG